MTILSSIALAMTILPAPAAATTMVNIGGTISGGVVTGGTTFTDNQAGVDANPAIGILDIGTFLNSVAVNFVINGFTSTSGSPMASLTLSANANLQPAVILPFAVDVFVTDNDFTGPPGPLSLSQTVVLLSSQHGLNADASAVGYFGNSNVEFDVAGPATGAATSHLVAGSATNVTGVSGVISGSNPYSLTMAIHVDVISRGTDAEQNIQVSSNLAASQAGVPEPGSVILFSTGAGLLGLTGLLRRKLVRP